MEIQELIGFQNAIADIYEANELSYLRGLHLEHKLNSRPLLSWYFDVTRLNSLQDNVSFNYEQNIDDLCFCSDELLYFTAHLYLYSPYINNPLNDAIHTQYGTLYPNYQNKLSKRYEMYLDVVGQVAYNYWDRIGDLIASFFPDKINSRNIYFGTALECIPEEYHCSIHYQWLENFKNNEYSEINRKRKDIVHYTTSGTHYKHNYLQNVGNVDNIINIQNDRLAFPEFYKNHISLSIRGLEKTLLLLEEINKILFP